MTETPRKSWPKGIGAITLFVDDLEVTKQFYLDAFGLPVVYEDGDSAVFRIGGTLVNLLKHTAVNELIEPARAADRDAGARHVISIPVDDVDAVCSELAARGVPILNGPIDRPWGIRTASFQDPAGHIWEISR